MLSKPDDSKIAAICDDLGISVGGAEVAVYRDLVEGAIAGCALVDDMPDDAAAWSGDERSWQRPTPADNPFNAWYVTTNIAGKPGGALAGRRVAIKDNVLVGGVPLMNGTSILEGYVPPEDATIVTRILEAGATIAGKSVCEAYCFSGGSHTASSGFVTNPHDAGRSAGGSSSGSGALVAGGVVDMAIGCDQGGSIRMPASFCGVVGMKPTHGLVPYTGILGMGPSIDHAGPMTATVRDNALLLEVIAGPDGLDSRQYAPRVDAYLAGIEDGVRGLRVGLLREGFGGESSEADVDAKVRAAAERLGRLGADVREVSVPLHAVAPAICFSVIQSTVETIFGHDGCLISRLDPAVPSLVGAQHAWRDRADELPANVKVMLMASEFLRREHGWEYVAKGVNQIRRLRAAYDAAFADVDVLLLPTTPMKATELPAPDADPATVLGLAFAPLTNTMAFNNTHHPAISVPCAMSDGLPVGMMLVGRHFEESRLYRAAFAYEQHEDWREL